MHETETVAIDDPMAWVSVSPSIMQLHGANTAEQIKILQEM